MRRTRLLWQLFPTYLLITFLSLLAITWYANRSLRHFYFGKTEEDLEVRARLVRSKIQLPIDRDDQGSIDRLCDMLGKESSTRITVILSDGVVLGDSHEDPLEMENHANRPEVIEARAGRVGTSTRYSTTRRTRMMYVAIPVYDNEKVVASVRTAIPLTAVDQAVGSVYRNVAVGGVIIALMAAGVSLLVARRFTRPLERLRRGVERYARGELDRRIVVAGSEEIGSLAEAINRMAEQLAERIQDLTQQRNQEEAVLASMVEAVLAVDTDGCVMMANEAATHLFGFDCEGSRGKPLQEVLRNRTIQELVTKTMHGDSPVESEITIYAEEEKTLQVHGTVIEGPDVGRFGALIVFNDITHLRRLEKVRRDFVANVSHELKTPVTTIKGFVETLLGGAMADRQDAERFLGIIAKHTDRLNAIIEDLLSLSRIEQQSERSQIPLQQARLHKVLGEAVELCRERALAREIEINLNGDAEITFEVNAQLVEQAVVNLIDNAIKFSNEGDTVEVSARRHADEVEIRVTDHGCGIEPEHLPRLFERFYRTDKARSRTLGGTGLGLAIVKHIALAHGGRVGVESRPGKGSTFSLFLPA